MKHELSLGERYPFSAFGATGCYKTPLGLKKATFYGAIKPTIHYSTLLKCSYFDVLSTLLPEIERVLFQATELPVDQSNHKVEQWMVGLNDLWLCVPASRASTKYTPREVYQSVCCPINV